MAGLAMRLTLHDADLAVMDRQGYIFVCSGAADDSPEFHRFLRAHRESVVDMQTKYTWDATPWRNVAAEPIEPA